MKQAVAIARKELSAYFGSPLALIFVGTFLAVTLFTFFWVDKFFARNIADLRPLFRWMPVLLIFLVAALTMRQWSEEQRSGTLEVLLTLPVQRIWLVLGKFLAVIALVALSLALTLFVPLTVALLGRLDWGPVLGGYLAALLMASAYAAIGLFVSSRTDNQIVSLIVTVLLGGTFYLPGTNGVTGLAGKTVGEVLRAIGTGSRFESIERGVIDLRDLIYYLSLSVLFLMLNVISLEAKRWSRGPHLAAYRRQVIITLLLVAANLIALNTWLFPLAGLRADLTADRAYSLSPVTRDLIRSLQEPLLIRGYFSEKTHPLLAPLVPAIRDLLQEYEIAARGKIQIEIVDPRQNEEIESEANQVYGIQPTPFRIAGRYEASVINSYFDLLVRYGDQHVILSWSDLIEVEQQPGDQVKVRLRNPEYDLTRSIKKVVYGFQSLDAVFASIQEPIKLTAFITPNALPEGLQEVPRRVEKVAKALQEESGGAFTFEIIDPDAPDSPLTRQTLINSYNLRPILVSPFSEESYYLDLILQIGSKGQLLYPSGDMSEADIRTEIESALKRAAPGFLKTVGVWLPQLGPVQDPFTGSINQPLSSWNLLREQLSQNYTVKQPDLSSGRVPGDVDVLVVVAPQDMSDKERFAIDQYLMRGGAVIVAAGNYLLSQQQFPGGLTMEQVTDGLQEMLASYGVQIENSMVLDPRNEPFPVQVARKAGSMQVIEIQQVNYPYFVDVRPDSMDKQSPIVANLPAVTLQWASPLSLDQEKMQGRQVSILLQSTAQSWLRDSLNIQPQPDLYPEYGFPVEGEQAARPLAVALRGSFDSFFKGKASPFQTEITATTSITEPVLGTIETSPESARLVVIGSAEFIDDAVLNISSRLFSDRYLNNLQFVQNAVDWSAEDEDLLSIRSRGTYARLLKPLDQGDQQMWEGLNYAFALVAVVAIGVVWNVRRRKETPLFETPEESSPSNANPHIPDEQGGDNE